MLVSPYIVMLTICKYWTVVYMCLHIIFHSVHTLFQYYAVSNFFWFTLVYFFLTILPLHCCSWRGPTVSALPQKEATQWRHEKLSKLLAQDNEVGSQYLEENILKNIFCVHSFIEKKTCQPHKCHMVSCDIQRLELLNRSGTNDST